MRCWKWAKLGGSHAFVTLAVEEALGDITRERIPNADFRVGDMEDLPFSDRVFDAVIAASPTNRTDSLCFHTRRFLAQL